MNVDKAKLSAEQNEALKSFEKMKDFASKLNAKINLVTICTPYSFKTTLESTAIMDAYAKEFQLNNFSINIHNDTNVEKGVLNFANSKGADLIGFSTHGRIGLSHFFNGSITEDLVNHSEKPVITFKL